MTTPYQERAIADPAINIGDENYFEAAAQGRLLVNHCGDCGQTHHYPRPICPFCFSDRVTSVFSTFSLTLPIVSARPSQARRAWPSSAYRARS